MATFIALIPEIFICITEQHCLKKKKKKKRKKKKTKQHKLSHDAKLLNCDCSFVAILNVTNRDIVAVIAVAKPYLKSCFIERSL